jgi:MFS family permease
MMGSISAVVSLPIRFWGGWLSDRLGRKRLMMLGYLGTLLQLLVLAWATSLGHFVLAASLAALASIGMAVGPAWVTDLASSRSLGARMSLYNAIAWGSGVVGFAGAGYAIEHLGMRASLILAACLPLASILVLVPVRRPAGERQVQPQRL